MRRTTFQTCIISLVLTAFVFVIVYETINVFLKDSPVEISYAAEEENAKSEKEKDEADELFFQNFFISVSESVTFLNYSIPFTGEKFYTTSFYSEIIPPPPKS